MYCSTHICVWQAKIHNFVLNFIYIMIDFGAEFKYHRQRANLSQKELADLINTSQQNISRWEKNEVEPSISFCVALADYYGISLDELIGREK